MDAFSLKDKVVIVTGGTGVLGNAFINAVVEAGGSVGILGRNADIANERADAINKAGGKALALVADVMQEDQLIECRTKILDHFGRIDGLVNGAGGNMPGAVVQPGADLFSLDMEALRQVMELNMFGTILPTQVFGKSILETAGTGSIINISSVSAHKAITRVLGYSMAKTAIEAYTKWFALELAIRYKDAIRMNAIVPGFFLTEQNRNLLTNPDGSLTDRGNKIQTQTPFSRFGEADELTGALVWLMSDASKFVNGTSIVIDGGFLSYSGV